MSNVAYQTPLPQNLVSMNSESLIIGRTLRLPIYNENGFLLLAEGMAITQEFRNKLVEQKLATVKVHPEDVSNISCYDPRDQMYYLVEDEDIAQRLDEFIDGGFLNVVKSEPALIEQIARHGTADYDLQKHFERVDRNRESSAILDNLMRAAVHGRKMDFSRVTRMAASFMDDMVEDIDSSIAAIADVIRLDEISDHCIKMSQLGMAMGVEMHLDAPNIRNLGLTGLVHDWGMLYVSPEIRNAERMLTAAERALVAKHPLYTLRLLEKYSGVPYVVPVVAYQVHECPNGHGYPQGETGERIHIMSRILSVADRYHALVSPRPFRPPLTPYAAMECLLRQAADGDIDADVVRALLMLQSLYPIGSHVVLSDGSTARVIRRNGNNFCHPIVRILKDHQGKDVPENSQLAIVDLIAAGLNVAQVLPNPGSNAVSLSPQILQMCDVGDNEEVLLQGNLGTCLSSKSSVAFNPVAKSATRVSILDVPITSLENYSEAEKRRAFDALEILDNSAQITDRTFEAQRTVNRIALRTVASICLPDSSSQVMNLKEAPQLRVLTRDVSSRGLSFICPDELPLKRIMVGLHVNSQETKWFLSEVVRVRDIADTGFLEHAVIFRQSIAN